MNNEQLDRGIEKVCCYAETKWDNHCMSYSDFISVLEAMKEPKNPCGCDKNTYCKECEPEYWGKIKDREFKALQLSPIWVQLKLEAEIDPDVHYDNCTKHLELEEKKEFKEFNSPIADKYNDRIKREKAIREVYEKWKDKMFESGMDIFELDMWKAIKQYCEVDNETN